MNKYISLFIIGFITLCLSNAARASLDYKCLSNCVNGGERSSICMPKCTYAEPTESIKVLEKKAKLNPHNQFDAMISPDSVIEDKPKAVYSSKTMNYTCLSECLKNKLQYQFCEEKCVPVK